MKCVCMSIDVVRGRRINPDPGDSIIGRSDEGDLGATGVVCNLGLRQL